MGPCSTVTGRRKRWKDRVGNLFNRERSEWRKKNANGTTTENSSVDTVVHPVKLDADGGLQQQIEVANCLEPTSNSHPPTPAGSQESGVEIPQVSSKQSNTLTVSSTATDPWPENLWDDAYKREDSQQGVDDLRDSSGQEQLRGLLLSRLNRIKEARLNIPVYAKKLNGKSVVRKIAVREHVCCIIRGLQSVSGFVNVAVSPMPPAALAWAGVLVVLPAVVNALTQDEEALNGLEYIQTFLSVARFERIFAVKGSVKPHHFTQIKGRKTSRLHITIKNKIIQLYSDILRYQIQLAIHYHHGRFRRALGDFVIANDWKGMVEDLENASDSINQDLTEDDRAIITSEFSNLRESAEKSMSMLKDVQEAIEGFSQDALLRELPVPFLLLSIPLKLRGRPQLYLHRSCLAGTRIDTLRLIEQWSENVHDYKCIFGLKGMPGIRKSTIARTVATTSQSNQRNSTIHYPSIAADRGVTGPQAWDQLIFQPRLLLDKILCDGLYRSFVLVFVIDALDECEHDEDLKEILPLFSQLKDLKIIQLRVFMTSRPENLLRCKFNRIPDAFHHDEELYKIKPSNAENRKDDITTKLFEHELALMKTGIPLQDDWPGQEHVKQLVFKADGLFIYAATACRFIKTSTSEKSANLRLSAILSNEVASNSPQRNIDNIYTQILRFSLIDKTKSEKAEIERLFRQVLGPVVALFDPLSAESLSKLLSLPKADIDDTLRDLHSLLSIPEDEGGYIQTLHLSFSEFLVDQARCPSEFLIDSKKTHQAFSEVPRIDVKQFIEKYLWFEDARNSRGTSRAIYRRYLYI
ncbi:hypothetical protein AJ79_04781 [Helicocarpus griseus UAMH5409]|uniref:Uncharacterized protein n=1 Tax=Helicocarpus griseus UAMH5409 TaxID=1447875 RepID=A0A2B7XS99_9EURO|nr:hypothetical protein AJ79_04781 [Helicocarpus griseus UAMH5409]